MESFLETVFLIFLGYGVVFPIIGILVIFNELYRLLISISLILSRSKYRLIPSGMDSSFYAGGTSDPDGGAALMYWSSDWDPSQPFDLRKEQQVLSRIIYKRDEKGRILNPKMTRSLCKRYGYNCFYQDKLPDIANHVKLLDPTIQPENGNFFTEEEFWTKVFPHLVRHFPSRLDKPSWDLQLVEKVQFRGLEKLQSLRVFRAHHAYMDGVSSIFCMVEGILEFQRSGKEDQRIPWVVNLKSRLSLKEKTRKEFDALTAFLTMPYNAVKFVWNGWKRRVDKPLFLASESRKVRHYGVSEPIPVFEMRPRKGLSFVDLSLKVLRETVYQYLLVTDSSVPQNSKLSLIMPVGFLPRKNNKARNYSGLTLAEIYVSEGIVKGNTSATTGSLSLLYCHYTFGRFPAFVQSLVMKIVEGILRVSICLNSVPFTREKGFFNGNLIHSVGIGSAVAKPVGLGYMISRYGDEIRIFTTADDCVMSRQEMMKLLDMFANNFRKYPDSM